MLAIINGFSGEDAKQIPLMFIIRRNQARIPPCEQTTAHDFSRPRSWIAFTLLSIYLHVHRKGDTKTNFGCTDSAGSWEMASTGELSPPPSYGADTLISPTESQAEKISVHTTERPSSSTPESQKECVKYV